MKKKVKVNVIDLDEVLNRNGEAYMKRISLLKPFYVESFGMAHISYYFTVVDNVFAVWAIAYSEEHGDKIIEFNNINEFKLVMKNKEWIKSYGVETAKDDFCELLDGTHGKNMKNFTEVVIEDLDKMIKPLRKSHYIMHVDDANSRLDCNLVSAKCIRFFEDKSVLVSYE